jgi:pSer/pThr/pTyr-binding forkhead associated (FHA) protein
MDGGFLLREVETGALHPLPQGRTVAGRSEEANLCLLHDSISRNHAAFLQEQNALWIEDLRSSNGSFVQGLQVHGMLRLHPGDTVVLGHVRLQVELVQGLVPPPAAPPRPSAGDVLRSTQKLGPVKSLRSGEPLRASAPRTPAAAEKSSSTRKGWWIIGLLAAALGSLAVVLLLK